MHVNNKPINKLTSKTVPIEICIFTGGGASSFYLSDYGYG